VSHYIMVPMMISCTCRWWPACSVAVYYCNSVVCTEYVPRFRAGALCWQQKINPGLVCKV
jgi:hypothetical protein